MGRHVWCSSGVFWAATLVLGFAGCSDETGGTGDTGGDVGGDGADNVVMVSEEITEDTSWTADNVYVLTTDIFVTSGAELTIAAGTRIEGEPDGALIITPSGRIQADGSATDPIVFTCTGEAGFVPGCWGGLVLLGNAILNTEDGGGGTDAIEGLPPEENRGQYGGNDDSHDCGTVRYTRIELAGRVLVEGNELNGLTLGGCGSDTVVEYVQVHKGSDDGIEFFGGSADIRYFIASQGQDDGLDWQLGWTGRAQFGIVQAGNQSEHGFEADNFENGNDNLPRSNPDISNVTIVGANNTSVEGDGMRLRRGTAGQIFNTMVIGYSGGDAVDIDDAATHSQVEGGDLVLGALIFFDVGADGEGWYPGVDADTGFDHETFFGCDSQNGGLLDDVFCGDDPMLGDPFNLTAPDFIPASGGPATAGVVPNNNGFFDTSAEYIGAIEPGATTWWGDGWTDFP